MNDTIKKAVDSSQRAQRNYDLSKTIPQSDLETLIYAAVNSPSKQNETHYSLYVYTDQNIIRQIYNQTKLFSLIKDDSDKEKLFKEENGVFWQNEDMSVYNSQILANVIFVYAEDHGEARGGNSIIAQTTSDITTESYQNYMEQINYSIGISVGELLLTAGLLGYRTGLCSAFPKDIVQEIIGSTYLPKLVVGVGYENIGINRQLHAETLNRDVVEKFRTGPDDEYWRFPSFDKNIKVYINGTNT
jgi:nitroreductase